MIKASRKILSGSGLRVRFVVVAAAMFGAVACGSSSSHGTPAAAQPTNSSAPSTAPSASTPDSVASTSESSTLGSVDACTLLTVADFAAATDKVQPSDQPPSSYTLTTEKTKTDVGPAVDQHSACTYHFSGNPGASGELTLDVMTSAEYHSLGTFDTAKPITGLGDEAAVYGDRPAFLLGNRGALIANSSSSIAFGTELLRRLASHF
jgi:hypothetical protein